MVYDTINPEVLKFILQEAFPGARILDIGCGTGKLGKELKSRINCHITGIEIDEDSVKIARENYDEVIEMNLEKLLEDSCKFNPEKKFDFVVMGDVLEHITDAPKLLRCFNHVLVKKGLLIVSIPNIANWMIRLQILFGNFDYSGGILDQGHWKFFTYKTSRKLLQDCGYEIISVTNNNATLLIRSLGRIWIKLFAFQFVFKCRRK
jgi:methionine biosynthesis protein MetW